MMLLTASPVRLKPPTPGMEKAWERDCKDHSSQVMPAPADIRVPVPASPITAASLTSSSLPPIWGGTSPRSFPIYHMPVRRPWPQGYKFAPATGSVWLPPVPLTQPWQSISLQRAHAFALTGVIPSNYKRWLTLQEPILLSHELRHRGPCLWLFKVDTERFQTTLELLWPASNSL